MAVLEGSLFVDCLEARAMGTPRVAFAARSGWLVIVVVHTADVVEMTGMLRRMLVSLGTLDLDITLTVILDWSVSVRNA